MCRLQKKNRRSLTSCATYIKILPQIYFQKIKEGVLLLPIVLISGLYSQTAKADWLIAKIYGDLLYCFDFLPGLPNRRGKQLTGEFVQPAEKFIRARTTRARSYQSHFGQKNHGLIDSTNPVFFSIGGSSLVRAYWEIARGANIQPGLRL
jgi:hypothetical protein